MVKSVRVIVRGRVQGVAFRDWTRRQAEDLGLDGWVRNRRDGTVEAAFSGSEDAVDRMVQACWDGPRAASVTSVEIVSYDEVPPTGFDIAPTA